MARDYTKYTVNGIDGVFGKGKLVLAVVQDYCSKNECTFDELKQVFPDEAQGGDTGVFGHMHEAKEIAKKRARHYVKDPITIKDATIAVSTQWGTQIGDFISKAEEVGYNISTVEGDESANEEKEITPTGHLTAEQISEFKEREADIFVPGYFQENNAFSLYDEILEAGNTAWADLILQKIEDAADRVYALESVCKILKERGETNRFLATAKKAEAMAKKLDDLMSLAVLVSETDKDWALKLYQKAEKKAKDFSDLNSIGNALADELGDKENAVRVQRKAMTLIDFDDEWDKECFVESLKNLGETGESLLAEFTNHKSTPKPLINQINDYFREEEFEEMRTFFEELNDDEWDKVDSELGKLLKDDPKYFFAGIMFEGVNGANFDIGSFFKGTGDLVERFTIEKDPDKLYEILEEKPLLKIIIEKYGFSNNKIKQDNVDFKLLFSAYFISNLEVIIKTDDYENLHIIADFIINQSLFAVREFDIDDTHGDWIADFTLNLIAEYTGVKISEYEGEYYSGRYFSYSAEMGYDYLVACDNIINALA